MTEIRTPEDRETLDRRDVQRRIDLTLKSVARYIDRTARPGERQSIIAALAEAQEYVAILAARQPAPSAEDRERCGVCDRDGGQHWYDHGVPGLRGRGGALDGAMTKRLVILESPYAGDIERNVVYARQALADSLHRGEAPIASHLLYTQPGVLDDADPDERRLGIDAGLAWGKVADATVMYADLGITSGMQQGIDRAYAEGRSVEVRYIKGGAA